MVQLIAVTPKEQYKEIQFKPQKKKLAEYEVMNQTQFVECLRPKLTLRKSQPLEIIHKLNIENIFYFFLGFKRGNECNKIFRFAPSYDDLLLLKSSSSILRWESLVDIHSEDISMIKLYDDDVYQQQPLTKKEDSDGEEDVEDEGGVDDYESSSEQSFYDYNVQSDHEDNLSSRSDDDTLQIHYQEGDELIAHTTLHENIVLLTLEEYEYT
jgi:hypothetical protein